MKHAVVLDIGSSKIVSICAGRVGKDGMVVYGADITNYSGYRFAKMADEQEFKRAIVDSLMSTQAECGFRLRDITVSIPAPFTKLHIGTGVFQSELKPKRITDADIDMLMNTSREPMEGYSLMHSTPVFYMVDGQEQLELEEDVIATRIEATVSHVYVSDALMNPVREALSQFGHYSMCASSLLGAALMLIPDNKRHLPAVLIDVGYTHTDVCLVRNSAILAQRTIDVGGMHITNDLAYVLDITPSVAETIKRKYMFHVDYEDSVELLRTPQGTRSVDRATIQCVIEERVYELCQLIYETICEIGVDVRRDPIVYLTGGGVSMMRGSRGFFEQSMGFTVRKEMPWMPRLNSPNYASAYGTVEFVLNMENGELQNYDDVGVLRKLKGLFAR